MTSGNTSCGYVYRPRYEILVELTVFFQPCGERVLMTLAAQYPQYVTPLIETTFQTLVGQYVFVVTYANMANTKQGSVLRSSLSLSRRKRSTVPSVGARTD